MNTYKGKDRIAYVGDNYTAKVALSDPTKFGRNVYRHIENGEFRYALDSWKDLDSDQRGSLKHMLFHGVAANRREHRLAGSFRKVVLPTASVMGGIANIQPTVPSVTLDFRDIWGCFVQNLGPKTTKLGHMMEDVGNFGVYENRVMFVDGGSDGLEELLSTRASDIEKSLGFVGVKLGLSEI